MYDCRNVGGHIEVYCNGDFLFSADNYAEAKQEIREREQSKGVSAW